MALKIDDFAVVIIVNADIVESPKDWLIQKYKNGEFCDAILVAGFRVNAIK